MHPRSTVLLYCPRIESTRCASIFLVCTFNVHPHLNSNQISLMHAEQLYQYNTELLSGYLEQDLLEREERESLIKAYHELDADLEEEM